MSFSRPTALPLIFLRIVAVADWREIPITLTDGF